jgi:group I intron endonuclease
MIIYKATNKLNQKSYIGKTERTLSIRMNEHFGELKKDTITTYFHRALRKYGIDNFEFTILVETDSLSNLDELEIKFIKELRTLKPSGYNITEGGTGGNTYRNLDKTHREEIIKKSSDTRKKNYLLNPERKIKRSNISKEFWEKISQDEASFFEYKRNISRGLRDSWKDKILTDEDRIKYSTAQKNRFLKETSIEKEERIRKFKETSGTSKQWKLTYPDGTNKIVKSIHDFCKENNLPYNIIYGSHRKKSPSRHGWYLEEYK